MLGQTLRMKKKRVTYPSQASLDTQILFCDKNTLLQRGSVYTKKLKRLIGQAGWLTDWLTDWESKRTYSYILLHTALKHWSAFWWEGGGGVGTLILSYISRFCPFLEIQNFELHFLLGGGGARDQKNKFVWRYDEIMIYLFLRFFFGGGVISINLGLFKVNVQIWKMFLGSLKFEYVLGMPDIPNILGVKSRCWVQCQA